MEEVKEKVKVMKAPKKLVTYKEPTLTAIMKDQNAKSKMTS